VRPTAHCSGAHDKAPECSPRKLGRVRHSLEEYRRTGQCCLAYIGAALVGEDPKLAAGTSGAPGFRHTSRALRKVCESILTGHKTRAKS